MTFFFEKKYVFFGKSFAELKNVLTFVTLKKNKHGVVVQLVRIPACHAGGREFESRPYRNNKRKSDDFLLLFMVGCELNSRPHRPPFPKGD